MPNVSPLFWSFRIMVGLGVLFILLTATFFVLSLACAGSTATAGCSGSRCSRSRCPGSRPSSAGSSPSSGASPGSIEGVLPTAVAVSDLGIGQVALTILGFVTLYTVLAVIEVSSDAQGHPRPGPDHVAEASIPRLFRAPAE